MFFPLRKQFIPKFVGFGPNTVYIIWPALQERYGELAASGMLIIAYVNFPLSVVKEFTLDITTLSGTLNE